MSINVEAIAKLFEMRNLEELKKYRFTLWIGFLGPKTSYREFRLHQVDDFEIFALFGFKLFIRGDELINSLAAFEISRNVFVTVDSSTIDDWKAWLEMVISDRRPRIIPRKSFRNELGLPNNLADLEIFVLSIVRFEST